MGKVTDLVRKYGWVAFIVHHVQLVLSIAGFWWFIHYGNVDVIAKLSKLPFIKGSADYYMQQYPDASEWALAYAATLIIGPIRVFILATLTPLIANRIESRSAASSPAEVAAVYTASTPIKNIAEAERLLEEDGKRRATMGTNDGYSLRSRTPKKPPRNSA